MKANEIKLNKFLSQSDTYFVIPVYQRNYDWTVTQCRQLLKDILDVGTNNSIPAHFIGSIVYIHNGEYSTGDYTELTIIDGQQRLTTITLIYLVLYNLAKNLDQVSLSEKINNQYLINQFAENNSEKLKLRPTDNNDRALKHLIQGESTRDYDEYSRIIENYTYFKTNITEENFDVIKNGIKKLMFVEISLNRENDDPQRIFESLNSTGLELSEADLIRNYILMDLDRKRQNYIYSKYWSKIEKLAIDEKTNASKVSDFIRDFLTLRNKKIPNKNKVYQEFKINYNSLGYEDLEDLLSELKVYAKIYNRIINPENEKNVYIRRHLNYIKKLEVNVLYPFLLPVYLDYKTNVLKEDDFITILELLQSFTWRRFIVSLPTNALNKIFMRLYEDIDNKDYILSLEKALLHKKGNQRFPNDTEVINALKEKDLYNIRSSNKKYFFERLENYNNNEYIPIESNKKITIEHIFPQNPVLKWKDDLGLEEYNFIKDNYLNTISNLTLSGNNGSLGNKVFLEKRDMNIEGKEQGYKYSGLWLNRYIRQLDKWNIKTLERRFNLIRDRFLKIWWYPINSELNSIDYSEVNIFDAEEPRGKKLEYAIFYDQKLNIKTVSNLYKEVLTQLFDKNPQIFFNSDLREKLSITKNKDELRQILKLNDSYYAESNYDSNGKFDRIMKVLDAFGIQDELCIKYKS